MEEDQVVWQVLEKEQRDENRFLTIVFSALLDGNQKHLTSNLSRLHFDYTIPTNPMTYEAGLLRESIYLEQIRLPIFKGMRVVFTRNVRPDIDYVNGVDGIVQSWCSRSMPTRVQTSTGRLVAVWPYIPVNLDNLGFCPIRAGYAATTLK